MENQQPNTTTDDYVYDNGFHPHKVVLKDNYKFYHTSIPFTILKFTIIILTRIALFFPKVFVWNFKIIGKKNKRHAKNVVYIGNHVHPMDSLLYPTSIFKPNLFITTLQSNLGFPIVSQYFRLGGCVPLPDSTSQLIRFSKATVENLKKGKSLLIYPEASLHPYLDHIRPFKSGAFNFALKANSTIIPTVLTFHKPKGIFKLIRGDKPCMRYSFLEPYHIVPQENRRLTVLKMENDLFNIINDYYIKHSDYYYDSEGNKIRETYVKKPKVKKEKNKK